MTQTADFDRLMADVAAGSEDAIWQLAETYTPYIIRAVRANLPPVLRSKLDSQDLAQTLWASLLLKRAEFTRLETAEQLVAYLVAATRNKVVEKNRHFHTKKLDVTKEKSLHNHAVHSRAQGYRSAPRGIYSSEPTPSVTASLRERWQSILKNTPERDRQILQLRLQGHDNDSISELLKIHPATVRRAIQNVVKQLAE